MALIRSTLKIFEDKTCLHFKELTDDHTEKDYVYVEHGQGCASMVGKIVCEFMNEQYVC